MVAIASLGSVAPVSLGPIVDVAAAAAVELEDSIETLETMALAIGRATVRRMSLNFLHRCLSIRHWPDTRPTFSNNPFWRPPVSSCKRLYAPAPIRPTSMPQSSTPRQMMHSDFVL